MNFSELNLRNEILKSISEMGYEEATDIQAGSIPSILEGQDVTGRSSTGTGKTAAFGLPLVQKTAENADRSSVLILAPTRELALQITEELRKYAKYLPSISIACIYGGQPMDGQIRALKRARIVVGTPGRIMDHMRRKTLKLDHLKTIVLDEADEMLNMGFIDDIRTILESAPTERQTILFSATLSPAIQKITEEFQTETVFVKADKGQKTAAMIHQSFYYVSRDQKEDALKLLLEYTQPKKSLIFCNTKRMVDELADSLHASGYKAIGIHGDLKQNQRNAVMRDFKSGRSKILIATDVAARGIDVDNVEAVFNYDVPQELEYYVHRIGRTGRAGREGASYTLVSGRMQLNQLREIERYIDTPIEEKKIPSKDSILKSQSSNFQDTLIEAVTSGVNPEWTTFVETMVEQGYSAVDIAAVLCEKAQKKNKRLASIQDVEGRVSPKNGYKSGTGKRDRNGSGKKNYRSGKPFKSSNSRDYSKSDKSRRQGSGSYRGKSSGSSRGKGGYGSSSGKSYSSYRIQTRPSAFEQ
ncbi:MAG TPA: DEAD/DEAH box helicase [Candidatus Pelethocola excrementipullorum]|nr:DEAD/DEAH box helicase [Candidatus Pelethocola excrementipullorum]